ncbi:MAG: hypothetical protein HQK52_18200 [Oligoflexia bacterium]|nr:hypothetical protein [Oligoflexia bacterium]
MRNGFSLTEIMVALGLFSLMTWGILDVFLNQGKTIEARANHLKAKVTAESIIDTVASLSVYDAAPSNLYSFLQSQPMDATTGVILFTKLNQPWLAEWSELRQQALQDIELRITLMSPSNPSTPVTTLPTADQLSNFEINFLVTLTYIPSPGKGPTTFSFTKTLPPLKKSTLKSVAVGPSGACSLTSDGTVKCFTATTTPGANPGASDDMGIVDGLTSNVKALSVGADHSCALRFGGAVWCWPQGGEIALPIPVLGLPTNIMRVYAGNGQSCAITSGQGNVWCWGQGFGPTPLQLSSGGTPISGIIKLTMGATSIALLSIGATGQVMMLQTLPTLAPSLSTGPTGIRDLASSDGSQSHFCGMNGSNNVLCWGENNFGQLGNGNTTSSPSVAVTVLLTGGLNLSFVSAVSLGKSHSCALSDGETYCWGSNSVSQLGSSAGVGQSAFAIHSGLSTTADKLFVGGDTSCVLLSSGGGVQCFGAQPIGSTGSANAYQYRCL